MHLKSVTSMRTKGCATDSPNPAAGKHYGKTRKCDSAAPIIITEDFCSREMAATKLRNLILAESGGFSANCGKESELMKGQPTDSAEAHEEFPEEPDGFSESKSKETAATRENKSATDTDSADFAKIR